MHTPGPWWSNCERGTVQMHGWAVFARKPDGTCPNILSNVPQREVEANARLIAAAPDLLEAAQAARQYCEAMEAEGHSAYSRTPLRMIQAAIAKATKQKQPA